MPISMKAQEVRKRWASSMVSASVAIRWVRFDQPGKLRPARKRICGNVSENRADMIAPVDRIRCDIPDEGRLAERGQNGRSLRSGGCQDRLDLGHCQVILASYSRKLFS